MRKAFGFILTVVLAMSLIGCAQVKTTKNEENTSKEVATKTEAPVSEASTTDATATDASKANASSTDASATDASKVEASKTDATPVEASANDAVKASEELKENVIKTDGIDVNAILEEVENETSKRMVFAFVCDKGDVGPVFEADIANEGSDTVEITLDSRESLSAVVTGDVVDIGGDALHDSKLEGFTLSPFDRETEKSFSIKYSDGKVVNFIIHFPES